MPTEADTAARAATIESELQTSIDEAKADVARDAQSDEEKRIANERLSRLEGDLAAMRAGQSTSVAPVTPEPPAVPAVPDDPIARLESKVDAIAALVAKPIEPVKEAAAAIVEPVKEAASAAAEIVETVPKRTHRLFRPLWGGEK